MSQINNSNLGLIVAAGKNGEIGYQQNLIWRIKEDLTFFKNTTMGSYIIMGKNTYDSMPKRLPGREYVVLSRDNSFILPDNQKLCRSVEETLDFVSSQPDSKFLVVGGGIIYEQFMPYVDYMHITEIEATYPQADTYFPQFNIEEWNKETGEEMYCPDNGVAYKHALYKRKKY